MHKYLDHIHEKLLSFRKEFNALSPTVRHRTLLALLIVSIIIVIGIGDRIYHFILLRGHTEQQSILNVTAITPSSGPTTEEIMIPGTVEAWHEATIYARSPGFIETWYTDIGAQVKQGDLLAIIDAPEINAALLQAEADLKTAQANNVIAQITDKRWKNLLTTDSVSQQAADEKASAAAASEALVNAARANVERLRNLVDYQSVIAPFDGIISARYMDVGALINNGGSTTDPPLFDIIQSDRLRVYARVPQYYAPRLTEDMNIKLHFTEHPGKIYPATLISTAEAIDKASRTLLAEFMIDNANYELLPGSYVELHLSLPVPNYIVRIPINAILFRDQNLQVATLNKDGTVTLKAITVGRDFGDQLEIISGISMNDIIIVNPPDSIKNDQKVNVVKTSEYIG